MTIEAMMPSAMSARCPICRQACDANQPRWQVVTPRGPNPWTQCSQCSAYYLVGSYDLESEVAHTQTLPWGNVAQGVKLDAFKQRMFASVLTTLSQFRPPPARILDVGCSFGGFGAEAARLGYDVYGMDITPAAVEHVRTAGREAECCSNPDQLIGVRAASIDVVTCLDVQGMWDDQPAQLAAIRSKLRPGGLLALRVVDKSWMFAAGRRLAPIAPRVANRVMRTAVNDNRSSIPVHSLVHRLREGGFETVQVSIWPALHSDDTRWPAKASFAVGAALWPLSHRNFGPGALIVAESR
jgi:SAM-dependent methyltransferase